MCCERAVSFQRRSSVLRYVIHDVLALDNELSVYILFCCGLVIRDDFRHQLGLATSPNGPDVHVGTRHFRQFVHGPTFL